MSSLFLHGRRLLHLGVPLQNRFSFSSTADLSIEDGGKGKTCFTVSYLVDSLGLATNLAESISKRISFRDKGNPDSVVSLLRRYGFTDSQISTIVTDYPNLLVLDDAEKSIAPKLQFLHSTKGAELTDIVSKLPKLLSLKDEKVISLYYDFVKDLVEADKTCSKLAPSLSQGSRQENVIRNISVLRDLGVPLRFLFPLLLSNRNVCSGKERFGESLNKVVELGFDPTTSKFVRALQMVYQMSDKTIEEKVQVYTRVGFTEDDVWKMFNKFPNCLQYSEENIFNSSETFLGLGFSRDEFVRMAKCFPICLGLSAETVKRKAEFVVKQMNWPIKDVVMFPLVLSYSMKKRTVPRCNIIKALFSKGLLGSELPPLASFLKRTDEVFLEMYVRNHDDKQLVLELMAIFTTNRVS